MKTVKVEVLKDIGSFKKGKIANILVDENGTPLEAFWSRRFKDSLIDDCLRIIEENEEKIDSKKEKK